MTDMKTSELKSKWHFRALVLLLWLASIICSLLMLYSMALLGMKEVSREGAVAAMVALSVVPITVFGVYRAAVFIASGRLEHDSSIGLAWGSAIVPFVLWVAFFIIGLALSH